MSDRFRKMCIRSFFLKSFTVVWVTVAATSFLLASTSMAMSHQVASHISQAQDQAWSDSELAHVAFPALALNSDSPEQVNQREVQRLNVLDDPWGGSKPVPHHHPQSQYHPEPPIWPSVVLQPADLFEPSVSMKNDYDWSPWDSPYRYEDGVLHPRPVKSLTRGTTGNTDSDPRLPTASQQHNEDKNSEVTPIDRYLSELLDMDALPTEVTSSPSIASGSIGKSTRTPPRTESQRRGATGSRKGKLFLTKEGKTSNIQKSKISDQKQVFQVDDEISEGNVFDHKRGSSRVHPRLHQLDPTKALATMQSEAQLSNRLDAQDLSNFSSKKSMSGARMAEKNAQGDSSHSAKSPNSKEFQLPSQHPKLQIPEGVEPQEEEKLPVPFEQLAPDLQKNIKKKLPDKEKKKAAHSQADKSLGTVNAETNPENSEKSITREDSSSSRSKLSETIDVDPSKTIDSKKAEGKRPEPMQQPTMIPEPPSSSSRNSQNNSSLYPNKKKEGKFSKTKNSGPQWVPLDEDQLSALKNKGKWKVLYSGEKNKKHSQVENPSSIENLTKKTPENGSLEDTISVKPKEETVNSNPRNQEKEAERISENLHRRIETDQAYKNQHHSSSPNYKTAQNFIQSENGMNKINEENGKKKVEITGNSPISTPQIFNNNKMTDHDKHILSLMENTRLPEPQKPVCTAEMRFKLDYDSQANHFYSEYQKAKEAYKSRKWDEFAVSLMGPLNVETEIKRKIQSKIEFASKDLDLIPVSDTFERTQLRMYSEFTINKFFEFWGKENVLSWQADKLDIKLMSQLAVVLNLNNREPHFGILPIFHKVDLYQRFMYLDRRSLSKIISSIYKILGKEEATRRLQAFANYLNLHRISAKWKALKPEWCNAGIKTMIQAKCFERLYGISEDPEKIVEAPFNPGLLTILGSFLGIKSIKVELSKIYEKHEENKRENLLEFIEKNFEQNLIEWWKLFGIEEASRKFGIDIEKVLKIGDALQFGSDYYLLFQGSYRTPAEKAFSTILEIMTEPGTLPWMESPERAWLYNSFGSLYQDRLRELSVHIYLSRIESVKTEENVKSGFELIWCDLGLKLSEIPKLSDIKALSKEEPNLYIRIPSGPFSEYSKMAISTWFNFFYNNNQIFLSEEEQHQRKWKNLKQAVKHILILVKDAIIFCWK